MPDDEHSLDASLERAFAQAGISDDTPEAEAPEAEIEAPEGDGRARDEHGRFKAREAEPAEKVSAEVAEAPAQPVEQPQPHPLAEDAPARLDAAARAAWSSVPQEVRGSIHRTMREMEQGLQSYQQQMAPLKPWMERAQREGTSIDAALQHYVGLEDRLRQDPLGGLGQIVQNLSAAGALPPGTDLRTLAAHVLGQQPPERDQVVEGLRAEIASLKQGFGSVQQTFQQQREAQAQQQIEAFAAANPRFDELSGEIAQLLKTGYASDLQDAYAKAERLNPALSPAAQTRAPAPAQTGPTPTAHLSVKGAPSSGSAAPTRSATADEAIQRAFAAQGLI